MAYAFFAGLDVKGHTATLALVEKEADDPQAEATYHVRRLEQASDLAEADEPRENLVDRVQNLLAEEPYPGRTILVVNRTEALGQAVLREFAERGLSPVGIQITGGQGAAQEGSSLELEGGDSAAEDASSVFVSELDLTERLVTLEREGRLTLEHQEEAMSHLAHGLQSYRARLDESEQTESAEALGEAAEASDDEAVEGAPGGVPDEPSEEAPRAEAHNPFVISAALACWLGEERRFDPTEHLGGEVPTTGEAKRMHRPDTAR